MRDVNPNRWWERWEGNPHWRGGVSLDEKECVIIVKPYRRKWTTLTSSRPGRVEGSLPRGSSFPPSIRVYISHLVSSRGSQTAPHLNRDLSSLSSSPLKGRRDDWCSSLSPIKPSIELGRSVISVTKRFLKKEIFKLSIRGYPSGEAFRPLNPPASVRFNRTITQEDIDKPIEEALNNNNSWY